MSAMLNAKHVVNYSNFYQYLGNNSISLFHCVRRKKYLITPRGIVRLMVEWFLRQGNNDGFDGNRLLKTYVLSMEDKMAAGAFGLARNYG